MTEALKTQFVTDDGVRIVGDFFVPEYSSERYALLLHMMPADRKSWSPLIERLLQKGFACLAIDLRGHGESVIGPNGNVLDYHDFTDEQHQAAHHDVSAALKWLKEEKGVRDGSLALVGASIGSNLSLSVASEVTSVSAVVALSPGLDYYGVTTADRVASIPEGCSVLLVASRDDKHTSWETVHELKAIRPNSELWEFEDAGHGTDMYSHYPELVDRLADWVDGHVK